MIMMNLEVITVMMIIMMMTPTSYQKMITKGGQRQFNWIVVVSVMKMVMIIVPGVQSVTLTWRRRKERSCEQQG
jgi:hypothetical protein